MILRIEESRSAGDASPGKLTTHGVGKTARKAGDQDLARTNLAAVEMAVVLIVVALVVVAIILSTGCSNRQPQDLSAGHMSQLQQSQAAQVNPQRADAQSGSVGLSRSAVEITPSKVTPNNERLEDAKRNARETEVSDLSVGS